VALRETAAPQPVEAYLRRTAQEADLPETLVPEALAAIEGETRYDVLNAPTRVAQRLPVAGRIQVETAASRFLRARGNGP
jgi:hypothetical protein